MALQHKAELAGIGGLIAGLLFGMFIATQHQSKLPDDLQLIHEMRYELKGKCLSSPEVLVEIDQKFPDNDKGLITPEIIRNVLKDVVNHC